MHTYSLTEGVVILRRSWSTSFRTGKSIIHERGRVAWTKRSQRKIDFSRLLHFRYTSDSKFFASHVVLSTCNASHHRCVEKICGRDIFILEGRLPQKRVLDWLIPRLGLYEVSRLILILIYLEIRDKIKAKFIINCQDNAKTNIVKIVILKKAKIMYICKLNEEKVIIQEFKKFY